MPDTWLGEEVGWYTLRPNGGPASYVFRPTDDGESHPGRDTLYSCFRYRKTTHGCTFLPAVHVTFDDLAFIKFAVYLLGSEYTRTACPEYWIPVRTVREGHNVVGPETSQMLSGLEDAADRYPAPAREDERRLLFTRTAIEFDTLTLTHWNAHLEWALRPLVGIPLVELLDLGRLVLRDVLTQNTLWKYYCPFLPGLPLIEREEGPGLKVAATARRMALDSQRPPGFNRASDIAPLAPDSPEDHKG